MDNYAGQSLSGVDWGQIFSGLPSFATAQALALAWAPIAGGSPTVFKRDGYYEIIFTPAQEERVAEWILLQLNREPGPVRVELGGIAVKVITRKYWLYAAGLLVAGGLAGYALSGRRG